MIDIPLPRLIDDSGNTVRRIRPIDVSINLNIVPLSYASIDLPKDESLPARGWVELYTSMGSVGIYRVRSPQDAYGEDMTTAELEHAIVEVGDYLVQGDYDQMMGASTAMTTVFNHYRGSKWQLGSVSALGNQSIALEAKYVRVLESMLSILDQCPDCMMTFDFSTSPWTVAFAKRGTTVAAEGRLSRNVNSAKVIYDDTDLCTRVYYEIPTTENATNNATFPTFDASKNYSIGHIVNYGGTLYKLTAAHKKGTSWANTAKTAVNDMPTTTWTYMDADTKLKYGLIERDVSTGSDYTQAECEIVARDYLNRHKEPMVSVDISLEELSAITGEPFDTFTIGKLCRLALADYGVTVERVITGISWGAVYGDPFNVRVTLADDEYTAISFLHDVDSSGGTGGRGGGGGGSKKKQEKEWKEYYTSVKQDDKYIELMAVHQDENERILQQAGLYIDSDGVLQYARDDTNMWASHLQVQADRIGLVVEGSGDNAKIKAASIVLSINQAGSQVHINANKIIIGDDISGVADNYKGKTLDGTLTSITTDFTSVNELLAKKIEATDITADMIQSRISQISTLLVKNLTVTGNETVDGNITSTGTISGSTVKGTLLYYGNVNMANAYIDITDGAYDVNGSKTVVFKRADGTQKSITFNKGDTGAAYNNGWNDCIGAAQSVTRYTRSAETHGGSSWTHYYKNPINDNYVNIGADWYKTTQANAYKLPARK